MISLSLFGKRETQVESASAVVEQNVAKARERHAQLQAQYADAQRDLNQHRADAAQAALERAGADIDEWGGPIAGQAAVCESLAAALNTAQNEMVIAEQQLAEAKDAEQRAKSIETINGIVQDTDRDQQVFLAALDSFTNSVRRGAAVTLDCQSLLGYLQQISIELPAASRAALKGLRHKQKQIELGATRSTLPAPAAQPQPLSPPAAFNTKSVCLLFPARWICPHSGQMTYGGKGWDCETLPATAQRAVDRGLAYWEWDERTNELRRTRAGPPTGVDDSVNLDAEDVGPPKPPERWIGPSGIVRHEPPRWIRGAAQRGDVTVLDGTLSFRRGRLRQPAPPSFLRGTFPAPKPTHGPPAWSCIGGPPPTICCCCSLGSWLCRLQPWVAATPSMPPDNAPRNPVTQ